MTVQDSSLARPGPGGDATTAGPPPSRDADGPVLLVGLETAPAMQAAIEARLARHGLVASPVPGPVDVSSVAGRVRSVGATAVVVGVQGTSEGVHRLGRQLAVLGEGSLPVVALPLGGEGDDADETSVRRRAVAAVDAVLGGSPSLTATRVRREVVSVEDLMRALAQDRRHSMQVRGPMPAVAVVDVAEREEIRRRLGDAGLETVLRTIGGLVLDGGSSTEEVAVAPEGVLLLLRNRDDAWVEHRLAGLSARVAAGDVDAGGETVHVTPVIGWARDGRGGEPVRRRAGAAAGMAGEQLDLRPVAWRESFAPVDATGATRRRLHRAVAAAGQAGATLVVGVLLPFLLLLLADRMGRPVDGIVYAVVVVVMVVTALSVWAEGLLSLRRFRLPDRPEEPAPLATAIVAAYLPNESATILETLRSVLAADYPRLEVLLAYNTPSRLPVEDALEELARTDPRLRLVHVPGSASKAQNVNAALARVRGEFVGVFDADHHPAPDAFDRAWRRIAAGADVVQGRCVVRNGEVSLVTRVVAVEFESIYGVSHPGRSRLHGFAVFGGSNGYWRTDVLRRTRMQASRLTEDIDASVRLVGGGGRIDYDPRLMSYELAPTTVGALWWQRLRWAQGWFQVSRAYSGAVHNSFTLSRRQRHGMSFLLRWRELTPWVGQLVVPLVALALVRAGGDLSRVPMTPLLVLLLLVGLVTVPAQSLLGWVNASPELRRRPWWFVLYFVVGVLGYAEWRNVVARTAHLRELLGSDEWIVTPRVVPVGSAEDATAGAVPGR